MSQAFTVHNGLAPQGDPRSLPLVLDFDGKTSLSQNLFLEESGGVIDGIQSIYIDNADNAEAVTFVFGITGQRIICPANAQGFFAVVTPDVAFTASKKTAGGKVQVQLLNVPMPGHVWKVA